MLAMLGVEVHQFAGRLLAAQVGNYLAQHCILKVVLPQLFGEDVPF